MAAAPLGEPMTATTSPNAVPGQEPASVLGPIAREALAGLNPSLRRSHIRSLSLVAFLLKGATRQQARICSSWTKKLNNLIHRLSPTGIGTARAWKGLERSPPRVSAPRLTSAVSRLCPGPLAQDSKSSGYERLAWLDSLQHQSPKNAF